MINYIVFIIWLLLPQDNYDICKNFHEGDFIYQDLSFAGVRVQRSLNEQTEIIGDTIISKFSIKWISDCSYILIPQKVLYKLKEYDLPKDTINVSIIEFLSDTSYRYLAVTNGLETENVMVKVNY